MQKKKFGRYEISGELGRGAMGVVYKGRDTMIDRIVAVKTIKLNDSDDSLKTKSSIERLYQEAHIAGQLSHPNIATIYDVGEDNGIHYIVMEYIKGVSLEAMIRQKKPLAIPEKAGMLILTATALHYAHQKGVIHRDIKPANVIILDNLQTKIMDFGIAKLIAQKKCSSTDSEVILGTPFYMSPEQISGESLDRQTDIFSLGVLAYELFTGARPFQADNLPTLMKRIVGEDPLAPNIVNDKIPKTLSNIILKALKKEKQERYQAANEIADDLELLVNQTEMGRTQDVVQAKGYDKSNLIKSLKKNYPFFSDFSDIELRNIFRISSKKNYANGDIIFSENTVGNKMYIIITGSIKIMKRFQGHEDTQLNTLKAGECFGELAIMDSSPRFATAIAESDCVLIAINEVILRSAEPKLCLKLYKNLASVISEKLKKSDMKNNILERKLKAFENT